MIDNIATLEDHYADRIVFNPRLDRTLVSFQANKDEPFFRWFTYREGFSKKLVDYLISDSGVTTGTILDPFLGSGSTLLVGANRGLKAIGIELLPVGLLAAEARLVLARTSVEAMEALLARMQNRPWSACEPSHPFRHLAITRGAFPADTEEQLARFRTWTATLDTDAGCLAHLIGMSILEDISFTRKDGQYLRWDKRARPGGSYDKGDIPSFDQAMTRKLDMMQTDLLLWWKPQSLAVAPELLGGSNFGHLEAMAPGSVDIAITSPPYCNRYDYTRTYALELAYLDVGEYAVKQHRQALLSCTVEHKKKDFAGEIDATTLAAAEHAVNQSAAFGEVIQFLANEIANERLNNKGILTMVDGYFREMAIHIAQMAKVLRPGARYYVVNDNVSYNGLAIPVDCLLSEIAERLGFTCKHIWVLQRGKGNSSQQMAKHGRTELRKCIYVWERQ